MYVIERINALRDQMRINHIDAYLVTGTDPHLSEYTPDAWKTREWISGFTGSYGKVLITFDKALLWTDTRYFLQAVDELTGTGIELMKERIPDCISIEEWMITFLKAGQTLGLNGQTVTVGETTQLKAKLDAKGIFLESSLDLVRNIWNDRPLIPKSIVEEHPIELAGKSRLEKISLVRQYLETNNLNACLITSLDDLAWLFNIRGKEIQYTPLVTAYAYVDLSSCVLFIQTSKLTGHLERKLAEEGIEILDYNEFHSFAGRMENKKIRIDPIRTNYEIFQLIKNKNDINLGVSVTTKLKAVKSALEIENIRNAHLKDGAAMVNSIFWIIHNIDKELITERTIGKKLNEFRSLQPLFKGDSFHPIVGYGAHGAIVHYHATEKTDSTVLTDNLLLIDSGGQYLDGTTDITRTIALGLPTQEQKADFTLCLKAHISLATTLFPKGTKGYSLDAITRKSLWDNCLNYGHGTGHGIGYFLSVHEGPMSIRSEYNDEQILEGYLMSNEPGIYREGAYGIRTENVILCKHFSTGPYGDFLCFETLSLCPIDKNLITPDLLNDIEIKWLNQYHEAVYQNISPLITDEFVKVWLKKQCEPILVT